MKFLLELKNIILILLLTRIAATVALCGGVVGNPEDLHCRSYKIALPVASVSVTNSSYDAPADALIQRLKWPNIAEIIKREVATIVYKSLNGLAPTYLSNFFSKNTSRGMSN